jgi:hypothetical protein
LERLAKSAVGVALVIKWLALGAFAGTVAGASATQISPVNLHEPSDAVASPTATDGRKVSAPSVTARLAEPLAVVEQPPADAERMSPAHRAEPHPGSARVQPRSIRGVGRRDTPAQTPTQSAPSEPISDQSASPEARVLREEILALGRAKAALNRGAPSVALSVIREYRTRFPLGCLGPEATYIEMEAELASGNRARARALAERLASSAMPNVERARVILKGGKP